MKKKLVVLAMVGILMAMFAVGNALAGPWYTCTISQAGAVYGTYFVILTDTAATPAFTNTMFLIGDSNVAGAKEAYAAALTAVANSSNVWANIEAPTFPGPVSGLSVMK